MAPIFTGSRFGFGRSAAVASVPTSNFMAFSVPAPVESGKVTAGGYTWYTFTSSGAFTVTTVAGPQAGADGVPGNYISVMMVGGGASGGNHHGGGGGGGGVVYATNPNGYGVIDLLPSGNNNPIPIVIGAGGFSVGGNNATTPGVPGKATKFGSGPEPYHLIAYGGGGGGSHGQPNWYGNAPAQPQYVPMSSWTINETGPPSIAPVTNAWWNPNVPGGSNGGGGGPRSGGCGGGEDWDNSNVGPNPGPWPVSYGSDAPTPGTYGPTGGPGFANQPLAPSNSATYGYGFAGGSAIPSESGGGGGTLEAGNTDGQMSGGDARSTPANFWAGSGANHPVYPSPYSFGAGGGGMSSGNSPGDGGSANPGGGGNGGGSASGYGNGGGGNRPYFGSSGNGSTGIMIIKVKTS